MKKTKYLWYIWYISLGCTEIDRILLTKIVCYASTKCVHSCVRWVESRGLQKSSYSSKGSKLLSFTFITSKGSTRANQGQQGPTGVNPPLWISCKIIWNTFYSKLIFPNNPVFFISRTKPVQSKLLTTVLSIILYSSFLPPVNQPTT